MTVTRAPGRLDVMGGIADYSGSLVLQLPIAQACHVALQVQPLSFHRLWRHIEVRHCGTPQSIVRIVSLNGENANRSVATSKKKIKKKIDEYWMIRSTCYNLECLLW